MLIEFTVENFRSIKEPVTLSMVASYSDADLPQNLLQEQDLPGLTKLRFLSSAAIYGANASGKSNLLLAVKFMHDTVLNSATEVKPGEKIKVVPFLMDEDFVTKPTKLEMIFVYNEIRYQYGFELTTERIHSEWLYSFPKGRTKLLFTRTLNTNTGDYEYEFGSSFKGRGNLAEQTRENALFVSVGAQFNHDALTLVYEWFKNKLKFLNLSGEGGGFPPAITTYEMKRDGELKRLFQEMLSCSDLGIIDIALSRPNIDKFGLGDEVPEDVKSTVLESLEQGFFDEVRLHHRTSDERDFVSLDLEEESAGTQRLFALLGPFFDVINNGCTLFVDEIGTSLHPLLTRSLVSLFSKESQNTQSAQLIFTTHDTTLLDTTLLRRDQIWFTEKDQGGSTKLSPLSDFKTRKTEALQKGYLSGRYGAIPFLTGNMEL